MISRHLLMYLMATSTWILGDAFRGPHHPSTGQNHHSKHAHPSVNREKKIIRDTKMLHDQRHIAEDLGQSEFFETENLSATEMDFRFFRVHDYDQNMKLDGTELYHAILHQLERSMNQHSGENVEKNKEDEEETLARLIDAALVECDANNDGYLSYSEFKAGRARVYAPIDVQV